MRRRPIPLVQGSASLKSLHYAGAPLPIASLCGRAAPHCQSPAFVAVPLQKARSSSMWYMVSAFVYLRSDPVNTGSLRRYTSPTSLPGNLLEPWYLGEGANSDWVHWSCPGGLGGGSGSSHVTVDSREEEGSSHLDWNRGSHRDLPGLLDVLKSPLGLGLAPGPGKSKLHQLWSNHPVGCANEAVRETATSPHHADLSHWYCPTLGSGNRPLGGGALSVARARV